MDIFSFDINSQDAFRDGNDLVFLHSDDVSITLRLDLVDASELFSYTIRDFNRDSGRIENIQRPCSPDQHEIVEFMKANAYVCVLRIDKDKSAQYVDMIEEAEALEMKVRFEPDVDPMEQLGRFFQTIEELAA